MSTDSLEQSLGECGVKDALAGVRDCRAELLDFFDALSANLKELADRLQEWESADRGVRQPSDMNGLDERIQRLAELTDDFAESLDQLKNKTASPNNSQQEQACTSNR